MITYKVTLERTDSKSGKCPISIRLTKDRKSRYLKLGISILEAEWNSSKSRVNNKNPNANVINKNIANKLFKMEAFVLNNPLKSTAYIIENFDLSTGSSFYDFYETILRKHTNKMRFNTLKNKRALLNKVKEVRPELTFAEINIDLLTDYQEYWLKKGNSINTISTNIQRLGGFFDQAVSRGYMAYKDNPLLHFKVKFTKVEDKYFSANDIKRIAALKCEGLTEIYRDMYVFSFFCAGVRFSDLCTLKIENIDESDNRLRYRMGKTDRFKDISLMGPAMAIYYKYKSKGLYLFPLLNEQFAHNNWVFDRTNYQVELYKTTNTRRLNIPFTPIEKEETVNMFEYLMENNLTAEKFFSTFPDMKKLTSDIMLTSFCNSKNSQSNLQLGKVQRKLNLSSKLTFHTARHSFVNYGVEEKIDLKTMQEMMGHANIATTQNYMRRFDNDKSDLALTQLFGSGF